MAKIPVGQHGAIRTVPVHRAKIATGRYKDVVLIRHDGRHYADSDAEHSTQLEVSRYRARTRHRDPDGRFRVVQGEGPSAAAAERALRAKLADRRPTSTGKVNPDTTISDLWRAYEAELIARPAEPRTMDAYRPHGARLDAALGGYRIRETTTQVLDGYISAVAKESGPSSGKTAKAVLSGMFRLAVRLGALQHNPVRDTLTPTTAPAVTVEFTPDDARAVRYAVRESTAALPPRQGAKRATTGTTIAEYCHRLNADLADPVTFMAGTGCRIGEVLAVRWSDVDLDAGICQITGHMIWSKGAGMSRTDGTKSRGTTTRTIVLPAFLVAALMARKVASGVNAGDLVFPSSTGTIRDQNSFNRQWRRVRDAIGYPGLSSHDFRRALATILDAAGLTARVAADQLGHTEVSMTQNVYFARGGVHEAAAAAIESQLGNAAAGLD